MLNSTQPTQFDTPATGNDNLNVLFVSSEAVPFAKVGGLADVVGSLPAALGREGVDARVLMPGYGFINHEQYNINYQFSFDFYHRDGKTDAHVYMCVYKGVTFYFVQAWPYFGNDDSVYAGWQWDVPRFLFFNQLIMSIAAQLKEQAGWFPNVIHANDWHTGLIPFLVANNRWRDDWAEVATLMTIHNIAYQGDHVGGYLWISGIDGRNHWLLDGDLNDNLLAIAIAYSDAVTTVSPTYAREIQYPHAGFELAGLISARSSDLYGILNGIDTDLWNPATDNKIDTNYSTDDFIEKRRQNKRKLQEFANLPQRDDVPIVGVVSRLTWQKGFDMALPALRQLYYEGHDFQFIGLGTGDAELEREMWRLSNDFPNQARAFLQYDAAFAQQIYSGCDIFLMPSHFEPCGIGQMLAMRYGALPIVRRTGGLADTVENYDDSNADYGTGFVFEWEEIEAVVGTLRWALYTYRNRPDAWQRMQHRAMLRDFSWSQSARDYINVYRKITNKHKRS